MVDFFINRGKDMEFYLNHLRLRPYTYGKNVLPHDMGRRQFPVLDTRLSECNEVAKKLGFEAFHVSPRYQREEMVGKAREFLGHRGADHGGLRLLAADGADADACNVAIRALFT